MLETNGLAYISTPRGRIKREGGCAIVAATKRYNIEKIEVANPDNVEVVYGLLRPRKQNMFF